MRLEFTHYEDRNDYSRAETDGYYTADFIALLEAESELGAPEVN